MKNKTQRNYNYRKIILVTLFAALYFFSNVSFADIPAKQGTNPMHKLKYEMLVDGEKIGSIESTRKQQTKGDEILTVIEGKLDIHIESFFGDYSLSTSEEIKLGSKGAFQYFARYTEDSDRGVVKARDKGNTIHVELKHNKEVHSLKIDKKDFDTTSEQASGYFLDKGVDELAVRVLDLDEFEVENMVFKKQGKETITIAGKKFSCYVITFKSKSKNKRGKQWVTHDHTGTWIVKEEGVDAGDKYIVKLTDMS